MIVANIDTTEVAKFSTLAAQWWNPNGPCAPLHILNPCRLRFIQQHAKLENKTILDVGCGAGILTESLTKQGAQVIGLDASHEVISAAREHAAKQQLDVTYHAVTIEDFIADNSSQFDILTCMELIEHVPDPQKLIADCAALLKPGGQMFLSTLNRTPKAYLFAVLGAEYVMNILPKNTHDYKKFLQPAELASMLQAVDLRLTQLQGVKYQPFTKSASMDKDLSVNYMAYAVKEA